MKYAQIRSLDISNGPGCGISIFTQGCPFSPPCKGCHNSSIWNFDGGKPFTSKTVDTIVDLVKPEYIKRLSILGGEPLVSKNLSPLAGLIESVHKARPDVAIIAYTGYTLQELQERRDKEFYLDWILNHIDFLIDGRYEEDKRDITLAFRGSRNQIVWDMRDNANPKDVSKQWDEKNYK